MIRARRNFLNTCKLGMAVGVALLLSSCATVQTDPKALHSKALTIFDNLSPEDLKYVEIDRADITTGVISDYIEIIDYMAARNDFRRENLADAPAFPLEDKPDRVVFYHRGAYSIDAGGGLGNFYDRCYPECTKLLFEGLTDRVAYVTVSPDTRKAIPESIVEFRKAETCKVMAGPAGREDYQFHDRPALGLCTEKSVPQNADDVLNADGLHVYDDRISPLWPAPFYIDNTKLLPSSGILAIAYHRAIQAFTDLEHVEAHARNVDHTATITRSADGKERSELLEDHFGIFVEPALPVPVMEMLVSRTVGERYLTRDENGAVLSIDDEPDTLSFHDNGEIYHGPHDVPHDILFDRDQLNYETILAPDDIVDRLSSVLAIAKRQGRDAPEWGALVEALEKLSFHHARFKEDLAVPLAPIILETAQNDIGMESRLRGTYRVLTRMPHGSMAPYVDELIGVIEATTAKHGYDGLNCPANANPEWGSISQFWSLAEILNGAGPGAAPYLDKMYLANKARGNRCERIGGELKAADCIGMAGPAIKAAQRGGRGFNPKCN